MAEKVGLIAVLDMTQFNSSFASYTRALNQMNSQTSQAAGGMGTAFLSLGDSVNALAAKITTGLVVALAAAGAAVGAFVTSGISQATDLEAQLSAINAILGNTEEQGKAVKDAIIDLGINPNLKVTAAEAANAVELLARNGLSVNEIIGETGNIMDSAAFSAVLLANATGSDFGLAADIATDAMAIFNIEASDMVGVVDDIVGVVNNSKFRIEDYNIALRNGGAAAADMGVSLTDFNTVIAASAEELGSGQKAGTGFRVFINRLTPNTQSAAAAMRELGLITADGSNIFFDATGTMKDMSEISKILNQTLLQEKEVMVEVGGRTAEQNALMAELQGAYANAEDKIRKYDVGLIGLNLSEEARNKKIAEQQDIMAHLLPQIQELTGIRGELVTTTSKLTDIERSMALESIFGADALNTVLALAKEGAPAFTDVADAMRELGVSQEEATRIVEEGTTAYEILFNKISQTDAVDQAAQRMDNFRGTIEILKGIIEAIQLQIGDAFLPILTELGRGLTDIVDDVGPKVVAFFEQVASFISTFVQSLLDGQQPLTAFTDTLKEFGLGDIASKIEKITTAIEKFIVPIIQFTQKHSDAFIGGLQGIGGLLATAGIAAKIVGIAKAIMLLNPWIAAFVAISAAIGAAIKTDFAGVATAFSNIVQSIQDGTFTWQTAWQEVANVVQNVWAMIEPSLTTLITNITTWFTETDWGSIGQTMWDSLLTAGGNLGASIQPKLLELFTSIQTWFAETDWAAIGATLYQNLLGGASTLGEGLGTALSGILTTITNWINTVDWSVVGSQLLTALGNGVVLVLSVLWTYLNVLYEFIASFVQSADWATIALDLVTAIITGLGQFYVGIGETLTGWYLAFVTWFNEQDWNALGLAVVNFIITGLSNFATFVIETLAGWDAAIRTWFESIDWMQIGLDIVFFILDGLVSFIELVVDTLAQWYAAITDWFEGIDWEQIGYDIADFIIKGLEFFYITIPETLAEWLQAFWDWIEETDWEALGIQAQETIIEGLDKFVTDVVATLVLWWNAIFTWFTTKDWSALAQKVIDGIIGGLEAGVESVRNAVSGLVSGITSRWDEETESDSPSKLFQDKAKNITDGIAKGLHDNTSVVAEAMTNMIADGIEKPFEIVNKIAAGFSSFTSPLIKQYKDTLIKPMTELQKELQDQQKGFDSDVERLQDKIADNVGVGFFEPITQTIGGLTKDQKDELKDLKSLRDAALQSGDFDRANQLIGQITRLQEIEANATTVTVRQAKSYADLLRLSKGQMAGASPEAERAARQLLEIYKQQNMAKHQQEAIEREILAHQEKLAAIEKQQADLKFLQQQMDFLDFIAEQGLNAGDILGGLQLGLDADLGALLQAMSGAMQAVIQTAQTELGIASPSKVFEQIAKQVWQGFDRGSASQSTNVMSTMRDITRGLVSTVTNGVSSVTNNNNRSRSLQLEVNNSFANQPAITDRSQLELLLASFV